MTDEEQMTWDCCDEQGPVQGCEVRIHKAANSDLEDGESTENDEDDEEDGEDEDEE